MGALTLAELEDRSRDMCKVCKTDRYLSPNMTFLINPECYHKICESCVDRIFSLGPAPCPYPGCDKNLRKNKFKQQVFDDLAIEKEVDVRRRVNGIYNKTEDDFPNLREYNEYLELIETITFNLVNRVDYQKTESDLVAYENEHKFEIIEKNIKESQKNADFARYKEAIEKLKQEKAKALKEIESSNIEFEREQKEELLNKLSNSSANPEDILRQQQTLKLKRSSQLTEKIKNLNNNFEEQLNQFNQEPKEPEPVEPFTPFQGDRELSKNYELLPIPELDEDITELDHKQEETYYDPYVNKLAKNKAYLGAGWRVKDVFERALDEAFLGLSCFIDQEKAIDPEKVIEEEKVVIAS